jgi:hypothetical protein
VLLSGCFRDKSGSSFSPTPTATAESLSTHFPSSDNPSPNEIQPSSTPVPSAQAASPTPIEYANDGANAVLIQLKKEPRLHTPMTTLVANTPQTYALWFREAMNRASVEEALAKQTSFGEASVTSEVKLQFDWRSDQELQLIVESKVISPEIYRFKQYKLDINGAKTASDKTLRDSPWFGAVITKPNQLWRIPLEGGAVEKISSFEEPYWFQAMIRDTRYMLAFRFTKYCECDASYPKLYAIYDTEKDSLKPYPVDLQTNYRGPGDFIVDTRGFFYTKPDEGIKVPASDTAIPVHIDAFIHGAGISRDGRYIFAAAGDEKQDGDLDLIVYDLKEKKSHNYAKALLGKVPESQVSSAKEPVTFLDDGTYTYTSMIRHDPYASIDYQYNWDSGKLLEWKPPIQERAWTGFIPSSDGQYRFFYNGGLYHGNEKVTDLGNLVPAYWLNSMHSFVYAEMGQTSAQTAYSEMMISVYDVNRKQSRKVTKLTAANAQILGGSSDGQWIYISSSDGLLVK